MKKSWQYWAAWGACCVLLSRAVVFAEESEVYTYSSFQLKNRTLTIELEINPHLLQQVRVLHDLDGDGLMSELEFEGSRPAILQYVQEKISITLNDRLLRADSTAIAFRFENSSPLPHRIVITCAYAVLLQPHTLTLQNEMFQELSERSRSYGALSDGKQTVDFEFRPASGKASAPVVIEFSSPREWRMVQDQPTFLGPTALGSIAGALGLLLLAAIAKLRARAKRRRRHRKRRHHSPAFAGVREPMQYERNPH